MIPESKTRRKHGVAFTMAQARKALHPYPVYEAHFADNTVLRMSFWTKAGQPFDFDTGRAHCEIAMLAPAVDGFIEHDDPGKPWIRVRDPRFSGEATAPRKMNGTVPRQALIKELTRLASYAGHLQAELIKRGVDFSRDVTLDEARAVIDKAA